MPNVYDDAVERFISAGEVLYLSRKEVVDSGCLNYRDLIAAVEQCYVAHAQNRTIMPKADYLLYPGRSSYDRIIALYGHVADENPISGLKQICSSTLNKDRGFPRASGIVVLNDPQSNRPFCLMEAGAVSAARTAAVSGLALTRFAKESQAVLSLIGCGELCRAHIRMI